MPPTSSRPSSCGGRARALRVFPDFMFRTASKVHHAGGASVTARGSRVTGHFFLELDLPHLLRLLVESGHEKAEVGTGRDVARAHLYEFGGQVRPARQSADAD